MKIPGTLVIAVIAMLAVNLWVDRGTALADHIQINEQQRYWLSDDRTRRGSRLEEALERGSSPNQQGQRAPAPVRLPGYTLSGDIARQLDSEDRQKLIDLTAEVLRGVNERSWLNPRTGVVTIARQDSSFGRGNSSKSGQSTTAESSSQAPWDPSKSTGGWDDGRTSLAPLKIVPPLERIDGWYRATRTLRVRGGPNRRYAASHIVDNGEKIHVIGQVVDSDWVMVSHEGRGIGFVFGRLLDPVDYEQVNFKQADRAETRAKAADVENQANCKRVIQEAILANGSRALSNPVFCPTADGHWELI